MSVSGSGQAQKQKSQAEWVSGQGWTTIDVWEGPTEASILGLISQLAGYTRIRYSSPDGTKWRLEASAPVQTPGGSTNEPPENVWELTGSPETKDIRLHPYFSSVSDANRRAIETAISDKTAPTLTGGDATLANQLYQYLFRGQTSYYEEQVVLRHTATGATYDDIPPGLGDDLSVFTTAQLPRSEITPAVNTALNDLVSPTVPTGYVWGWLKVSTTVRQNVFSKAQLVEEWRLDLWPSVLY
jgi:hypothetical protein